MVRKVAVRRYNPSVRERQYKHIFESLIERGMSEKKATRIAAATVNKTRSRFSKQGRGPKLVSRGGSRRQWYPGKGRLSGKKHHKYYCLRHKRKFTTKRALLAHLRGKAHRRDRKTRR